MHWDLHLPRPELTSRDCWFIGIVWAIIIAKCIVVKWAVAAYAMPFNAWWIILPTLFFAAIATVLWVWHRENN